MRENEPARAHEMGRDTHQNFTFGERFANKPEVQVFQIAQATMNQLGGGRRSGGAKISLLTQINRQSASRCVARNAAAIDAAADDRNVINQLRNPRSDPWRRDLLSCYRAKYQPFVGLHLDPGSDHFSRPIHVRGNFDP